MYVEKLHYTNIGPIKDLNLQLRFNEDGTPCPTIIVGKNGSGKSILLSNIVDAFYEISAIDFNNTVIRNGKGYEYYKEIGPTQIRIGQEYMVSNIYFKQDNTNYEYIFKSGNIPFDAYKTICPYDVDNNFNWQGTNNYKKVNIYPGNTNNIFNRDIVCFFSPERYAKPSWMGREYNTESEIENFSIRQNYTDQLKNPIKALNSPDITLQWLFDIITDSRADLVKNNNKYSIVYPLSTDLDRMQIARENIEQIMSEILEEDVGFLMKNRIYGKSRFSIIRKSNGTEISPSLDSLSTGQLALFNVFSTIVRYADNDNINLSYRLNDISGIVVIDEVEMHLHSSLQCETLPKLIKLFPKVQFIITSHSPLFLLGMKEQFGKDNFDIINMPDGEKISAEQFSEFQNAYEQFSETNKYKNAILAAINKKTEKTLIITEGATDWKHMKAAYNNLIEDSRCSDWLPNLDFEFLEYEPENSNKTDCCKLKMSGEQLVNMCEQYSLILQKRKMIFIADCDVKNVKKVLQTNETYKNWGNNVYSFCLPVPSHRLNTPEICIEHMYTDEEIKREVVSQDGCVRRIFIGNEFDEDGCMINGSEMYFCKNRNSCGKDKIDIIDGSDKKKVVKKGNNNDDKNYALTKMDFATSVLEKEPPFDNVNFSEFIPIFERIRDIIAEPYMS